MKISFVLTNDWELYGEGSGDFYQIQYSRLHQLLAVAEAHGAKVSLFAEIGQQIAHQKASTHSRVAQGIARHWEESIIEMIGRGHDAQLHWHPTWEKAELKEERWELDLRQWKLTDVATATVVERLREGRLYLESLGRLARPSYRCVAFRAGAFCMQPSEFTVPILREAGFLCDSSILPGFFDYLHFDYRQVPYQLGPYWITQRDLSTNQELSKDAILELPIHTEPVIDSPLMRKILGRKMTNKILGGVADNDEYLRWAKHRDHAIKTLSAQQDPLEAKRMMAKAHPRWWMTYIAKRSSQMLDIDFTSPEAFLGLVEDAVERAQVENRNELVLTMIGHANNSHNFNNLDRILKVLRHRFKSDMQFTTLQQVTERAYHARAPKAAYFPGPHL